MSEINTIWHSTSETEWLNALTHYWDKVQPRNRAIEEEFNSINSEIVRVMDQAQWYDFLLNKYFRWKYTAPNRYASTTMHFKKYASEGRLAELLAIKDQLFSFPKENIRQGLEITSKIRGLGTAGASGLLAVLFPQYFGTVDQFLVEGLNKIDDLPENNKVDMINKDNINIDDGIIMIDIMRRKAQELNVLFHNNNWTPRKIDMVFWGTRE
jgi:hypothetical protein